jgi:hypothetical protein
VTYSSTILADTPVCYYRMSESSGLTAHDATTNHYNATLPSGCTYAVTGALIGDSDTAITLPAGGSLILPWQINITTWSAITVELWLKQSAGWNMITITYTSASGGTLIYYLNGTVTTATTSAGGIVQVGTALEFVGNYAAGTFDEVAIFNYVLSPLKITAHLTAATAATVFVLFPTMRRRSGTMAMVRRDGASVAMVRRDGAGMSSKRRDGAVPYTPSRRSGPLPTTQRRDGTGTIAKRRDGQGISTKRRLGMAVTTQRRG